MDRRRGRATQPREGVRGAGGRRRDRGSVGPRGRLRPLRGWTVARGDGAKDPPAWARGTLRPGWVPQRPRPTPAALGPVRTAVVHRGAAQRGAGVVRGGGAGGGHRGRG